MKSPVAHIISSLNWNTTFNEKEKAHHLQDRLSGLSRLRLQREITQVFDDYCPEDQVWRIDSLELDLGVIDINYLETEVTRKIRQCLIEKLNDLINYGGSNTERLEILDSSQSHIEVLRIFLTSGIFSWNFKSKTESINSLVKELLKENRKDVIEMIRFIGKTDVNVRRRIAWQIEEPSIRQIIHGLEPGESNRIIDFSDELVNLQRKEAVIQASISDFKKNLWFWVLNYLLAERGSIFNKIAFVKSSIRQMANHYNINYLDLLKLLDRAVNIVTERYNVNSSFVSTIKILVKEDQPREILDRNPDKSIAYDYRELLMEYFESDNISLGRKKDKFNKLVITYSKKDAVGFRNFIHDLNNSDINWLDIVSNLEDQTLEMVFTGVNGTNSPVVLQGISFFNAINKEHDLGVNRNWIWFEGVKLMLANKSTMLSEEAIVDYLSDKLLKEAVTTKKVPLFKLGVITPDIKTSITISNSFTRTINTWTSQIDEHYYTNCLDELLDELAGLISFKSIERQRLIQLKKMLITCIRSNSDAAYEYFYAYNGPVDIYELFTVIFSPDEIFNLFLESNKGISELISLIENSQDNVDGVSKQKIGEARTQLILFSFAVVLKFRETNSEHYINSVLENISNENILALWKEKKLKVRNISEASGLDSKEEMPDSSERNFHSEKFRVSLLSEMIEQKKSRIELLAFLKKNFTSADFIKYRQESIKKDCWVLNHIIANGNALRFELIENYLLLLKENNKNWSQDQLRNTLNELFWKCVVKANGYYGQANMIECCFFAEVKLHFDYNNSKVQIETLKEDGCAGSIGKWTHKELIALLKKLMDSGVHKMEWNGELHLFKDLFAAAIDNVPAQLYKLIQESVLLPGAIKLIKNSVSFDQFCMAMTSEGTLVVSKAIHNIHSLIVLITNCGGGNCKNEIFELYWDEVLNIIRKSDYSRSEFHKFVGGTFNLLMSEKGVTVDLLIEEVTRMGGVSNDLIVALTDNFSVIDVEQRITLLNSVKEKRDILHGVEEKGLIYEFCLYLINHSEVPDWSCNFPKRSVSDYLIEMIFSHPAKLRMLLKHEFIPEWKLTKLHDAIGFENFISGIVRFNNQYASSLSILKQFYFALDRMNLSLRNMVDIRAALFRKLISAWTTNDWRIISASEIWNGLFKEISFNSPTTRDEFLSVFEKNAAILPAALRISLGSLSSQENQSKVEFRANLPLAKKIMKNKYPDKEDSGEILIVKNAGLVLINNYVAMLLERIGIIRDRKFVNIQKQMDAIHYLQYIVTGQCETEEAFLPLNKVLCGVPISQPITDGVEISPEHKKTIESLIQAVMGHWPDIGESSINGFRGNWLVREGKLSEKEDRWELLVEKRAYDILINKSPFSFSIIKHPWMDKPLHVTWTY